MISNDLLHPSGLCVAIPEPPLAFKLAYNKEEAAEMLSVSVRTLETLLALKELPYRRIGRRVVVTHQALIQFLRSDHRTAPELVN